MQHFRNGVGGGAQAEGIWSGEGIGPVQGAWGGLPGGEQIADKQACRQLETMLITTADKQIDRTEQQKTKQQS